MKDFNHVATLIKFQSSKNTLIYHVKFIPLTIWYLLYQISSYPYLYPSMNPFHLWLISKSSAILVYTLINISAFMSWSLVQYLFTVFFSSEIKFAYNEVHQYWDYMDFDKCKPFWSTNFCKDTEFSHHIESFHARLSLSYLPQVAILFTFLWR